MEGVYILHYETKLHHAQHYIGYSPDIPPRINKHRRGRGSHLTRAFHKLGIHFTIVRIYEGANRADERRLKDQKNTPRLCPICNPHAEQELTSHRYLKPATISNETTPF